MYLFHVYLRLGRPVFSCCSFRFYVVSWGRALLCDLDWFVCTKFDKSFSLQSCTFFDQAGVTNKAETARTFFFFVFNLRLIGVVT